MNLATHKHNHVYLQDVFLYQSVLETNDKIMTIAFDNSTNVTYEHFPNCFEIER